MGGLVPSSDEMSWLLPASDDESCAKPWVPKLVAAGWLGQWQAAEPTGSDQLVMMIGRRRWLQRHVAPSAGCLNVSVAALTVPAGQAGRTAAPNSAYAKNGMDSERIKDKSDL